MVDLTEIEALILPALYTKLGDNSEELYDLVKPQALEIIAAVTGLDVSGTGHSGNDWIVTPFAFLVEYLAGDRVAAVSPEYEQRRQLKWKQAHDLLKLHNARVPTAGRAKLGGINGELSIPGWERDDQYDT